MAQMLGIILCTARNWFDSQSGHMSRFLAWSSVENIQEAVHGCFTFTLMFLSPFFSLKKTIKYLKANKQTELKISTQDRTNCTYRSAYYWLKHIPLFIFPKCVHCQSQCGSAMLTQSSWYFISFSCQSFTLETKLSLISLQYYYKQTFFCCCLWFIPHPEVKKKSKQMIMNYHFIIHINDCELSGLLSYNS